MVISATANKESHGLTVAPSHERSSGRRAHSGSRHGRRTARCRSSRSRCGRSADDEFGDDTQLAMMKLVMRGWPTANFSLGVIGVRQQLSRSGNLFLALLVHRPR